MQWFYNHNYCIMWGCVVAMALVLLCKKQVTFLEPTAKTAIIAYCICIAVYRYKVNLCLIYRCNIAAIFNQIIGLAINQMVYHASQIKNMSFIFLEKQHTPTFTLHYVSNNISLPSLAIHQHIYTLCCCNSSTYTRENFHHLRWFAQNVLILLKKVAKYVADSEHHCIF